MALIFTACLIPVVACVGIFASILWGERQARILNEKLRHRPPEATANAPRQLPHRKTVKQIYEEQLKAMTPEQRRAYDQERADKREIWSTNKKWLTDHKKVMSEQVEPRVIAALGKHRAVIESADLTTLEKRKMLRLLGDGRWHFTDFSSDDEDIGMFSFVVGPEAVNEIEASWEGEAKFALTGASPTLHLLKIKPYRGDYKVIYDSHN